MTDQISSEEVLEDSSLRQTPVGLAHFRPNCKRAGRDLHRSYTPLLSLTQLKPMRVIYQNGFGVFRVQTRQFDSNTR